MKNILSLGCDCASAHHKSSIEPLRGGHISFWPHEGGESLIERKGLISDLEICYLKIFLHKTQNILTYFLSRKIGQFLHCTQPQNIFFTKINFVPV